MTTLLLRRSEVGLVAGDEYAAAGLRRLKLGERIRVTINRPRNTKQHAKYWVLCDLVAQHHADLHTREQVHEVIKMLVGHCDVVAMRSTGEVIKIPRSIGFASMNQEEFDDYYRRACDAVVEHLLPGVALREVQEEVLRLVA